MVDGLFFIILQKFPADIERLPFCQFADSFNLGGICYNCSHNEDIKITI